MHILELRLYHNGNRAILRTEEMGLVDCYAKQDPIITALRAMANEGALECGAKLSRITYDIDGGIWRSVTLWELEHD